MYAIEVIQLKLEFSVYYSKLWTYSSFSNTKSKPFKGLPLASRMLRSAWIGHNISYLRVQRFSEKYILMSFHTLNYKNFEFYWTLKKNDSKPFWGMPASCKRLQIIWTWIRTTFHTLNYNNFELFLNFLDFLNFATTTTTTTRF